MIYTIKNISFPSNTYILSEDRDKSCIIIDPGIDYHLTENIIFQNALNPLAIICTHGHFDHIANVSFFKDRYKIPFYIHHNDIKTVNRANFFLNFLKINFLIKTPVPDFILKEKNNILNIGLFKFEIKNLPGHSPGSCIIKWGNNLFTGDIIYKKGLGLNSFPDENKIFLKESINEILESYHHENMVYPGHGEYDTLDAIKKNNKELIYFLQSENNIYGN